MFLQDLNESDRAELERILSIEPVALSESEQAHLRARQSYLTEEQKAIYAEILGTQAPEAPVEEAEEAPAKKSKK